MMPTLGKLRFDTSIKSVCPLAFRWRLIRDVCNHLFSTTQFLESYIGSLVKNAVGNWELAVKTNVSQNRCRVFWKSPWWNLSCDDDVWFREQATMNRAQNSFVDEQLERVQSARRTSLLFCRSQDKANTTSNDMRPV